MKMFEIINTEWENENTISKLEINFIDNWKIIFDTRNKVAGIEKNNEEFIKYNPRFLKNFILDIWEEYYRRPKKLSFISTPSKENTNIIFKITKTKALEFNISFSSCEVRKVITESNGFKIINSETKFNRIKVTMPKLLSEFFIKSDLFYSKNTRNRNNRQIKSIEEDI